MGTSGNPAKRTTKTAARKPAKKTAAKKTARKAPAKKVADSPTQAAPTTVSDFAAFKQRAQGRLLPLPSGLVVRAHRVDLQTFVAKGTIPNPLMEIVQEALQKGQEMDPAAMVSNDEGEVDLEMVAEMMEIVDGVVVETVLEPRIHPMVEEGEESDDNLLYVNEVDAEDKMFIFQWSIGGTDDLERFREEATADLASLAQG